MLPLGSQWPWCENAQAALWRGPHGEELRAPTDSQEQLDGHEHLESGTSAPVQLSDDGSPPLTLNCNFMRNPSQNHAAKLLPNSQLSLSVKDNKWFIAVLSHWVWGRFLQSNRWLRHRVSISPRHYHPLPWSLCWSYLLHNFGRCSLVLRSWCDKLIEVTV